jgi:hypothetical protein
LGSVSCNSHGRLQGGWLDNRTLPERRSLSAPMGSFFVDRHPFAAARRVAKRQGDNPLRRLGPERLAALPIGKGF